MKEIELKNLDAQKFISTQVEAIRDAVGGGLAINALSGGFIGGHDDWTPGAGRQAQDVPYRQRAHA